MFITLISTTEVAQHLNDPDWVILDCRFYLAEPRRAETEYLEAHIPGAGYLHLDRDLSVRSRCDQGHPCRYIQHRRYLLAVVWNRNPGGLMLRRRLAAARALVDTLLGHITAVRWWLAKWQHESYAVASEETAIAQFSASAKF
jgi:thiosulfate/3-mercaptopyruvate sulfurtransferase